MKTDYTLVLSDDETVVKDWNYATTTGGYTSDHSLIVTNKRIIADSRAKLKNGETVSRQEMKLKDVAGVSLSSKKETFGAKAILCFVLGVLLIIFGILSGRESSARLLPVILLAILFIVLGLVLLFRKKSSLTVEITVKGEIKQALGLYANAGLALKTRKKSLFVKVNAEVANDIVMTLGSILLCD